MPAAAVVVGLFDAGAAATLAVTVSEAAGRDGTTSLQSLFTPQRNVITWYVCAPGATAVSV